MKRRLRIAQIAPPVERVPPERYGGTERVVSTLTEGLTRRGHAVTLFASGDSCTAAALVPTVEEALWRDAGDRRDFSPYWAITLGKLASRIHDFDIVHNHLDFLAYPLSRLAPCPIVTTLHGRLDLPDLAPLYSEFREVPLVSISDAQRAPVRSANWVATIHHGIDLEQFTFQRRSGQYLAYLGRISPDKGLDVAIRVARRTGYPLRVAARPPLPFHGNPEAQADTAYFDSIIQPMLDAGSDVEFHGELAQPERDRLLGGAAALLFPIRWPEPFGLVMVEALACGTPVVALNAGSVSEVIEHGRTGFVCSNEDQLVDAVERIRELDRAACRCEAERRFAATVMVSGYERVYEALLSAREPQPALAAFKPVGNGARTDADLAHAVCHALQYDPLVPDVEILSTVSGGCVTLEGTVPTRKARDAAERVVRRVIGVRDVVNALVTEHLV